MDISYGTLEVVSHTIVDYIFLIKIEMAILDDTLENITR